MRENEIDVRIGAMEIAKAPKVLRTVLGSCVALILYDKVSRVGGLAHIFLPEKKLNYSKEPDSKFANTAPKALMEEIIKSGAKRQHIFAFMVGGGNIFKPLRKSNQPTVAELNIANTKIAVSDIKIPLVGCDVGRDNGCKVRFDLSNGDMQITDLQSLNSNKKK